MFYISVSNGLLTKEHRKTMGSSVWEFMWCIDKITKIDEDGVGWVLGGKPITLLEISEGFEKKNGAKVDGLGSHKNTIQRNLNKLEDGNYLLMRRTPHGQVIGVINAKKRYQKAKNQRKTKTCDSPENKAKDSVKKRNTKNGDSPDSESQKVVTQITENGDSLTENGDSNIRHNSRHNSRQLITSDDVDRKPSEIDGSEVNECMDWFEAVNPSYGQLFKNKTQRDALKRLIAKYGHKSTQMLVDYAASVKGQPYAPDIATPYELEKKLSKLVSYKQREDKKSNSQSKRGITI